MRSRAPKIRSLNRRLLVMTCLGTSLPAGIIDATSFSEAQAAATEQEVEKSTSHREARSRRHDIPSVSEHPKLHMRVRRLIPQQMKLSTCPAYSGAEAAE